MKVPILLVALLLNSCATMNTTPIIDSSKRIDISGVSILPPQEGNWVLVHLSTYQAALAKRGENLGESVVIDVSLYKQPEFHSNEKFLASVKQSRANEPETGRFKLISNIELLTTFKESTCVKFKSSSEDRIAKTGKEKSENMVLESFGYFCLHPKNKTVGVKIEYSLRHYPGNTFENLEKKTRSFFENVNFIGF